VVIVVKGPQVEEQWPMAVEAERRRGQQGAVEAVGAPLGQREVMRRDASRPSISGICTSISTTS